MGFSLRMFAPHIYGCKSSCTPGSWWIAHSTTFWPKGCHKGYSNETKMVIYSTVQSRSYIININNTGIGLHRNFSIGRQSRHFACPYRAADDTMQMGVHITLYPFYTTKKMTYVTATVPKCASLAARFLFATYKSKWLTAISMSRCVSCHGCLPKSHAAKHLLPVLLAKITRFAENISLDLKKNH